MDPACRCIGYICDRLHSCREAGSHHLLLLLVLISAVALPACGYRFSSGGNFPGGAERIFITIFDNRTSEIGVENSLADAVTDEFTTRANAGAVAGSRQDADAVLAGRITSVRITSISRVAETVSDEARVVVAVNARLVSAGGANIWTASEVTATDTYKVVQDDKQITESNKNAALDRAAVKLAEKLYNRLVEDF
jgi:outer membrane lipopolysaccharide assembly protein LptE/RlpB